MSYFFDIRTYGLSLAGWKPFVFVPLVEALVNLEKPTEPPPLLSRFHGAKSLISVQISTSLLFRVAPLRTGGLFRKSRRTCQGPMVGTSPWRWVQTFVVLLWFVITLATLRAKITTVHWCFSKLCPKHFWFHFFPDVVYIRLRLLYVFLSFCCFFVLSLGFGSQYRHSWLHEVCCTNTESRGTVDPIERSKCHAQLCSSWSPTFKTDYFEYRWLLHHSLKIGEIWSRCCRHLLFGSKYSHCR